MQKYGKTWKPRFYEIERESKMRLLENHPHTSERQRYGADKGSNKKKKKERLPLRDRNESSAKAIAILQGGWGKKVSTEKGAVSTKNKAVLCPSMCRHFYPRLSSGGGGQQDEEGKKQGIRHEPPTPRSKLRKLVLCHKMCGPITQNSPDTEQGGRQDHICKNHRPPAPQKNRKR